MENLGLTLVVVIIASLLIASLGAKRKIGFGWSFVLCLFLSPLIGLIITLCSKRKSRDIGFVEIEKNNEQE